MCGEGNPNLKCLYIIVSREGLFDVIKKIGRWHRLVLKEGVNISFDLIILNLVGISEEEVKYTDLRIFSGLLLNKDRDGELIYRRLSLDEVSRYGFVGSLSLFLGNGLLSKCSEVTFLISSSDPLTPTLSLLIALGLSLMGRVVNFITVYRGMEVVLGSNELKLLIPRITKVRLEVLRVIKELSRGGSCIGYRELANELRIHESTIKRHLDSLVSNSLVIREVRGRRYCFRLSRLGLFIAELLSLLKRIPP